MEEDFVTYMVALEVATHEALVRQTYKDSVNVKTWCIGMTNATGHTVERYIGKPQSLQHCMNIYAWALKRYAKQVEEVFKGHYLEEHQRAAAVSFHWNTGAIKRASWVKLYKAGRLVEARKAFMNYQKPASLKKRRERERDLFFDGKWSQDGLITEYTRVKKNLHPDWSSDRRINIEQELRRAFFKPVAVPLDQPTKPDNKPKAPTVSPERTTPMEVPIQRHENIQTEPDRIGKIPGPISPAPSVSTPLWKNTTVLVIALTVGASILAVMLL